MEEPEWIKQYWDQIPYQWRYLRLKDYPGNKWLPGAGECESCGAPYEVLITYLDEGGDYGTVQIKIQHKKGCMDEGPYGVFPEPEWAGWEFTGKTHRLLEREFWPLKVRANVGPCLKCWKLVPETPLILFLDEGRGGELDFCFKCAEELGLLDTLKKQTKQYRSPWGETSSGVQ